MATVTTEPVAYVQSNSLDEVQSQGRSEITTLWGASYVPEHVPLFTAEALATARAEGKAEGMDAGMRKTEAFKEAEFLLERLEDLERNWDDDEEAFREFSGHVEPSAERLRAILAAIPAPAESAVPEQGERETAAARDVMAERERQKSVKGWTAEHDDEHAAGEMAAAACCYAFTSVKSPHYLGHIWPWSSAWWKPADKRRNLAKAGALILAEIERLDRAARLRAPDGEGV